MVTHTLLILLMPLLLVLTLGGPNTGSTVAGTLLGSPGENVAKLGTILPLSYQTLSVIIYSAGQTFRTFNAMNFL